MFKDTNEIGLGIIVRDDQGIFVVTRVVRLPGKLHVDEGEAMGLHEALSWIKNLGFQRVVVEMDSKLVVDGIASRDVVWTELGSILSSCRRILDNNHLITVRFIRRDANEVAHRLARAAKDFPSPHCWVEPPDFVDGLLNISCS